MHTEELPDGPFIDANGRLSERIRGGAGGADLVIHYDDIPESDFTVVNGLRCTTALRTMIDIAVSTEPDDLRRMVRDCLDRRLFSVPEALARINQPDLADHRGAKIFWRALPI